MLWLLSEHLRAEYVEVVDTIRHLIEESGGYIENKTESLSPCTAFRSPMGVILEFEYGKPYKLYTPDGSPLLIVSGDSKGDYDKFMELFDDKFEYDVIKEKRDDTAVFKRSRDDFRYNLSGPQLLIYKFKDRDEELPIC